MTDPGHPPPIMVRDDGTVLVSGAALGLMYRAALALLLRQHRDGVAAPALLHEARVAFYRAATSPPRHELADSTPTEPCCKRPGRVRLAQRRRSFCSPRNFSPHGPEEGRRDRR